MAKQVTLDDVRDLLKAGYDPRNTVNRLVMMLGVVDDGSQPEPAETPKPEPSKAKKDK